MIFEYHRSTKRHGVMVLALGGVIAAVVCAFGIPFVREDKVIAIVWALLVSTIFLPLFVWDGGRHLRRGGEFRSWLSPEKLGQEVPFADMGKSFEVEVADIAKLRRIDPIGDTTRIRWVVEMNDGKSFDLCDLYGNPAKRYFKLLAELRPEIQTIHERSR